MNIKDGCFVIAWIKGYGDVPYVTYHDTLFGWCVTGISKEITDDDIVDFQYIRRK
ncbi:MAG: hypothetical protein NC124_02090 [Clostridium sp.]|nr:hypothetical protein [Clostridium sp.]